MDGGTSFTFGRYQLNVESLELLRDGHAVGVPPKTFDVLVLLIKNRHRVVSKEEILKGLWRDAFVSDDSVSQCISSLRKALGDDSTEPAFITTVPRRGYRFIAAVTEAAPPSLQGAPEPAPAPLPVTPTPVAVAPPEAPRRMLPWRALAAAAASVGVGILIGLGLGREAPRPLRMNLQAPLGSTMVSGAVLSPDGTMAAFVAEDRAQGRRLWVTRLDGGEPRALPGTEGAAQPFWSPDSRVVAFFAAAALKKVSVDSGLPQTLAAVSLVPAGAAWNYGSILFAGFRSTINVLPDTGGPILPLTTIDVKAGDLAHEWPEFLPGGDGAFLYSIDSSNPDRAGTYVGSTRGGTPRRLLPDQHAIYAPPGYLVYVRDQTLMAQRFDSSSLEVEASPIVIGGNVAAPSIRNGAMLSAAPGLLAYGGGMTGGRLLWLDRTGQQDGAPVATDLHNPVAVPGTDHLLVDGNGVSLVDLPRGTTTRLVADGSTPIPSPDGRRVLFNAARSGGISDLYVRTIGSDDDELLLTTGENKLANDWTRDGRFVVFASRNARTGRDLWLLPMTGERTPVPFSVAPGNEIQAQVSPDGRWIAYASNETGAWQVYVQSFPKAGSKRAVSPGGGAKPQWRDDGRELYYLAPDRALMAAPVGAGGDVGRPQPLFQTPVIADLSTYRSQFTVAPGGQRFLFDAADPESAREPVTVLVNWMALANR